VHWYVKHNLNRDVINAVFTDATMITISNFTSFPTLSKRFKEMSYSMGIDFWKSGKVCYNCLADPNSLHNDEFTKFFYSNPGECFEFIMQHSAIREHMFYAQVKALNEAEDCIYSEVKSNDWWWNEQILELNLVIATTILISPIATAATWSSDCPCIRYFRPDTSFTQFG